MVGLSASYWSIYLEKGHAKYFFKQKSYIIWKLFRLKALLILIIIFIILLLLFRKE